MYSSGTLARLRLMGAPCLVQGIRASFVVGPPDSTSTIILVLLRLSQHLQEGEALPLLLVPLPRSPTVCLQHGIILVVICELYNILKGLGRLRPSLPRDNAHGRVLVDEIPDNVNMTVETCVGLCDAANFTVAGLEFAVQCCQSFPGFR